METAPGARGTLRCYLRKFSEIRGSCFVFAQQHAHGLLDILGCDLCFGAIGIGRADIMTDPTGAATGRLTIVRKTPPVVGLNEVEIAS
jgi:hypothetical protein